MFIQKHYILNIYEPIYIYNPLRLLVENFGFFWQKHLHFYALCVSFCSSEKSVKFCPNLSAFLFFPVYRLRLWNRWWWWLLNPECLWEHQWRGHTYTYPAAYSDPKTHTCNLHLITSSVRADVCKMRKKWTLHTTKGGKLQLNKNKDPTFLLFHRCVFWAHLHQVTYTPFKLTAHKQENESKWMCVWWLRVMILSLECVSLLANCITVCFRLMMTHDLAHLKRLAHTRLRPVRTNVCMYSCL